MKDSKTGHNRHFLKKCLHVCCSAQHQCTSRLPTLQDASRSHFQKNQWIYLSPSQECEVFLINLFPVDRTQATLSSIFSHHTISISNFFLERFDAPRSQKTSPGDFAKEEIGFRAHLLAPTATTTSGDQRMRKSTQCDSILE